jgi:hypothetical protein
MTHKTRTHLALQITLALFFILLVWAILVTSPNDHAGAAPPAGPTPIANLVQSDSALNVTFYGPLSITANTNTSGMQLGNYELLDLQYLVVMTTTPPNTSGITIQFSNENTNWVSGPQISGAMVAASNGDLQRLGNFGRYTRFAITQTNTAPITVTIIGLAK